MSFIMTDAQLTLTRGLWQAFRAPQATRFFSGCQLTVAQTAGLFARQLIALLGAYDLTPTHDELDYLVSRVLPRLTESPDRIPRILSACYSRKSRSVAQALRYARRITSKTIQRFA